jgi:hypothetical protein
MFARASGWAFAWAFKNAAKLVDMPLKKNTTRGPKKPPPKRISNKRKPHVSTYRVLKTRRQAK